MLRIALVDDNHSLRSLISGKLIDHGFELVFTATSGKEYHRIMKEISKERRPEAVLMDIEMPQMNGIEATRLSRELYPEIKIVILTVFDDDVNIFEAIKAGAHGYLLKDESSVVLKNALELVHGGGAQMSATVALKTMQMLQTQPDKQAKGSPIPESLTKREIEILELITQGKENHQIADMLFVSYDTVKKHVAHIFDKLHVRNKVEATRVALDNRWFSFL